MMWETDGRAHLARSLAAIDQLLAEAESLAELPDTYGLRETVLDTLIEFQELRRDVEAKLGGE
jgi:hypothetical protein